MVIAIVMVLAALSFTVVGRMMANGRTTKSLNNMRQISGFIMLYAVDSGDRLPALREFNDTDDPSQPVNWHWNQEVASMEFPDADMTTISENKEWWWRNTPVALNPQMSKDAFETYYSGYAMNLSISEHHYTRSRARDWEMILRNQPPLTSVADPARTPLLVPHWNWHTGDLLSGDQLNDIGRSRPFLNKGKLIVLFVDGHTEMISFATKDNEEPLEVSEYAEKGYHQMP